MTHTKLQQRYCMNCGAELTKKLIFCIVNINKACISTELAYSIYVKVDKNEVLRIDYKTRIMQTREKGTQRQLDEEQEKNPYETLTFKGRRVKTRSHANGEMIIT